MAGIQKLEDGTAPPTCMGLNGALGVTAGGVGPAWWLGVGLHDEEGSARAGGAAGAAGGGGGESLDMSE